jgi:two-component system NtrC family response regulator/two-component system response regulator HydG
MSNYSRKKAAIDEVILYLTDRTLPKVEEALIRRVLEETDWKLNQAARALDIARGTLYSKMKKYNIRRPF